jgi:hypothetical protein
MDIARYIGLFLLKNKYCCMQGLGNLELKKKPASYDGTNVSAGGYEAILNPTGSIDDALANFIANNEHVSIAKASNEIREFIAQTKSELAAGQSVAIPSVGRYVMLNGRLQFELDPAFSLPGQPVAAPNPTHAAAAAEARREAEARAQAERMQSSSSSGNKVNWGVVALWSFILLIVGAIAFFAIRYFGNAQADNTPDSIMLDTIQAPPVQAAPPVVKDSTAVDSAAMQAAATPVSDTISFNLLIGSYKTLAAAQKREKQLNGYGHAVTILSKDSTTHYVIKTMRSLPADTARIRDSIGKMLNPSGIRIIQ